MGSSFPWRKVNRRTLGGAGTARQVTIILAYWILLVGGLIWVLGPETGLTQEVGQRINTIVIQGNKRIESPAIRSRLTLKEGEAFTAERIREQIRALYQMGYFEDVRVGHSTQQGTLNHSFIGFHPRISQVREHRPHPKYARRTRD